MYTYTTECAQFKLFIKVYFNGSRIKAYTLLIIMKFQKQIKEVAKTKNMTNECIAEDIEAQLYIIELNNARN